jgi:hypothetical protein
MAFRRGWIPVGIASGLVAVGAVAACTPLGAWLYTDPSFVLSGVTIKHRGDLADTLRVVFTACNVNDFNVDALTMEARFLVDGTPIGAIWSDQRITLKMRDSVDLSVELEIPRPSGPPIHAKGGDYLATRYELNGKVELATPIGVRVVAIHQKGDVRFDSAGAPSGWTVRNARACHPGQSMLPGQGVAPRVLLDTMFRPQIPTGVPTNQPNVP